MDDLFKGMQMFQQGMKELAFTRALQRSALQQISNSLVTQMAQYGVPATTIEQVKQAVGPMQFGTPQAAAMEGLLSGKPGLVNAAAQADITGQAGNMAQMKMQQDFQSRENALNRESNQKVAGIRGQLANRMSDKAVENINGIDDEMLRGTDILNRVQNDSNLVGVIAGRIPGRAMVSPDFATFKADVGQWFDTYRKRITGAAASESEIKYLMKNRPQVTDTHSVFVSKLESILNLGQKVRERSLQNYESAGKNTGGFKKEAAEKTGLSKYIK
jgi:hypothetical protein